LSICQASTQPTGENSPNLVTLFTVIFLAQKLPVLNLEYLGVLQSVAAALADEVGVYFRRIFLKIGSLGANLIILQIFLPKNVEKESFPL
jgi:hypothetical protein